jgi:hypothetical protein
MKSEVAILVCPRCRRANPGEAAFCHFDGAELVPPSDQKETAPQTRLPQEFVFPSGRRCRSYDELIEGCQEEWEAARDLLRQGAFRRFLAGAGLMDLARHAQEARSQPDPDIALEAFLHGLPTTGERRPRLDLSPRRLNLGTLHVGDTRQVRLLVLNQGSGLLHGTLAVAEGNTWLRLGDGAGKNEFLIKTSGEQVIQIRVETRGLAAPHRYSDKLTVITNGGIVEVPVRLDLAARPFAHAPFQGASSPRDMAERMRTQPRLAVGFLENGEIARWFAANGWSYPVLGPTARGVAAVQQFFEGMGLSKPPIVGLAESEIHLTGPVENPVQGQIILRSEARKWIYARADADAFWLRVTTPSVSGPQQAVITVEAAPDRLDPKRIHEASLRITANANQELVARVRYQVEAPARPPRQRRSRPFLMGMIIALALRLILALPADLYARVLAASADIERPGALLSWTKPATADPAFVAEFVKATWWLGAIAGGVLLWKQRRQKTDIVTGLVAGAAAGLAASATVGCLMPALDALPRLVWLEIASFLGGTALAESVWLWTPLWISCNALLWGLIGGLLSSVLLFCGWLPAPRSLWDTIPIVSSVTGPDRQIQASRSE